MTRAAIVLAAAIAAIGQGSAGAVPPAAPVSPHAITEASGLLAAIQGGRLLGMPPLSPDTSSLATPEYWENVVREALARGVVQLPLPVDVVKPDVFLPHAPIAAGSRVSPLPARPVDLRGVRYRWENRTKTLGDFLRDTNTDSIQFVHDGTLVAAYYANGWSPSIPHQGWSMTKSFVSTLVGIALDQHRIRSTADPIEEYVPELRGTAWQGVTIDNLLRMRSGVEWDEHTSDLSHNDQVLEWVDLAMDYYSGGRIGKTRNEFLKSLPRVEPQGAHFNYDSANTQVLAWLLESVYHRPFNDILSQQLWQPAGMESGADIMTDRTGAAVASEALFADPRDYARFGELMRNDGRTPDGRRIVSAAWVRAATTAMLPARDAGEIDQSGYKYQWWQGAKPDEFQANGFEGNYITVAPAECVTGVRLAHTIQLSPDGDFAGQGEDEWQTVFRAVLAHLGGCRADSR
jgi:CubicO group peptidase (beta-lactamase class C family)